MNPPLCLPRTVEQHNSMIESLEKLIGERIGTLIGPLDISDKPHDDATALFTFKVSEHPKTMFCGSLTAAWTNGTHGDETAPVETYVIAQVKGEKWRIFTDTADF